MKTLTYLATIRALGAGTWLVICRNEVGQELRSVQSDLMLAFAGATGVRVLTLSHQDEELALLCLARSGEEFRISVHRRQLTIVGRDCIASKPEPRHSRPR